jgi:hypothetical protein
MSRPSFRLLTLCARADSDAVQHQQLAQAAASADWEEVLPLAEAQGMAPLLYFHLKAAGIALPLNVKRELQALYVRHRQASQVRTRVLRDILAACSAAGIRVLVLKGAALAQLVYPDSALRPMSDLDLLVREADLAQTCKLLAHLGFDVPQRAGPSTHRHLSAATLEVEGISVQVEIHHRLRSNYFDNAFAYVRARLATSSSSPRSHLHDLTVPPCSFAVAGVAACTLGHEDMLRHLCQHLVSHVNAWDCGRLIWVADIASFVTRFAAEIDWNRVRQQYPPTLDTLALVHDMSPLPDRVLNQARLKIGRTPQGMGEAYLGWPQTRIADWRTRGYRRVLRDTLMPSEWWLRLHYNVGSARPLFWYRWVRHPIYLAGHVVRAGLERIGWPSSFDLAGQ